MVKVKTKTGQIKLSMLMSMSIKQSTLLQLLMKATGEHRAVEERFKELIEQCKSGQKAIYPNKKLSDIKYFERNFFSILFLSTFISAGIEKRSRIEYGTIIHAIRTIITCTDNILDNEKKGAIFLNAGINNIVMDNIMLTIICQRIISQVLDELIDNRKMVTKIETELLDGICSVAKGETLAGADKCQQLKGPEEIIENIHKKIGGELLGLALIVPLKHEKGLTEPLTYIEGGVLKIGMALQMLDDVTDFAEDVREGRANLLASVIVCKSLDGACSVEKLQAMAKAGQEELTEQFERSERYVIELSITTALEGFSLLSKAGFPVNKQRAKDILKLMFRLRGIGNKWIQ